MWSTSILENLIKFKKGKLLHLWKKKNQTKAWVDLQCRYKKKQSIKKKESHGDL